MKYVVGSTSKRKNEVVMNTLTQLFPKEAVELMSYAAISGVPETPYDKETFDGAKNRARDAQKNVPADCYIGLESGLIERYGHMFEEAWCVILLGGKEYYGYSSGLKVPNFVLEKMNTGGIPHSHAMAIIEEEYKKTPNDTWGIYSGGIIARDISLEEALRNALIQTINNKESLYKK